MKIEVQDLSHTYYYPDRTVHVLDNLNFTVNEGEFVCILGPSGCGKSTLLHLVSGHLPLRDGAIFVDGEHVKEPGPDRMLVFQEQSLFPWLSVEKNIEFGLHSVKMPKTEKGKLIKKYLNIIKLNGFLKAHPHHISGGMQQRVAIARALIANPKVLLMDEPFKSLDSITKHILHEELQRIFMKTKKTILFVTHDLEEAIFLADRIILLSARPSRIKKVFDVNLDRPRDKKHPSLGQLKNRIDKHLQGELKNILRG